MPWFGRTKKIYNDFGPEALITGPNGKILVNPTRNAAKEETRKRTGYLWTNNRFARPPTYSGSWSRPSTWFTKRKNAPNRLVLNSSGMRTNKPINAQTESNTTKNVRTNVVEQNFLLRLHKNIENAIIGDNPIPLDFNNYQIRLQSPEVTAQESILLYNELIALFIMYILYIKLLINYTNDHPTELTNLQRPGFLKKIFPDLFPAKTYFDYFANKWIIGGATVGILASGGLLAIPIYLIRRNSMIKQKTGQIESSNTQTLSLVDIIGDIHRIMFSQDNKLPIKDVLFQLKYWGLNDNQVGFLFSITPAIARQSYIQGTRGSTDYNILAQSTNSRTIANLTNLNFAKNKLREILENTNPSYSKEYTKSVKNLINVNDNMLFCLLYMNLPDSPRKAPNKPLAFLTYLNPEERKNNVLAKILNTNRLNVGRPQTYQEAVAGELAAAEEQAVAEVEAAAEVEANVRQSSLRQLRGLNTRRNTLPRVNSMTDDKRNKMGLLQINTYLTKLRKTLRNNRGISSLTGYMKLIGIPQQEAPLLYKIFECLKRPKVQETQFVPEAVLEAINAGNPVNPVNAVNAVPAAGNGLGTTLAAPAAVNSSAATLAAPAAVNSSAATLAAPAALNPSVQPSLAANF